MSCMSRSPKAAKLSKGANALNHTVANPSLIKRLNVWNGTVQRKKQQSHETPGTCASHFARRYPATVA